jgi:hypothetical protein
LARRRPRREAAPPGRREGEEAECSGHGNDVSWALEKTTLKNQYGRRELSWICRGKEREEREKRWNERREGGRVRYASGRRSKREDIRGSGWQHRA